MVLNGLGNRGGADTMSDDSMVLMPSLRVRPQGLWHRVSTRTLALH